jgi:hypothetical protein
MDIVINLKVHYLVILAIFHNYVSVISMLVIYDVLKSLVGINETTIQV